MTLRAQGDLVWPGLVLEERCWRGLLRSAGKSSWRAVYRHAGEAPSRQSRCHRPCRLAYSVLGGPHPHHFRLSALNWGPPLRARVS